MRVQLLAAIAACLLGSVCFSAASSPPNTGTEDAAGSALLALEDATEPPSPDGASKVSAGGRSASEILSGQKGVAKDPMTELLHWAVEHSDPERLKEVVQKYKDNNLTIKDVYGQDVIDALFVNEGNAMRVAIEQVADFRNESLPDDDLEYALTRLQELIEQVDNAGNLHRMGGLRPLLELGVGPEGLEKRNSDLRALSLWTLGIAVQNNAPVQEDLLGLGGVEQLVAQLPRCGDGAATGQEAPEYCAKLLFAVSGLVRNNATIQEAADAQGLFTWLLDVGASHRTPAVSKKALGLLDTVFSQSPTLGFLDTLPARQEDIAKVLLKSVEGGPGGDTDLAEKALRVVQRLLSLRPMLFGSDFRPALIAASSGAVRLCEKSNGMGNEFCEGLSGIAKHTDLLLAARDVTDEEL